MSWDCQLCGVVGNEDGEKCRGCYYFPVPALLTLRTDEGKQAELRLSLRLNRSWARSIFGDDARFWDESLQMAIERRDDGWYLVPNKDAPNETLLDGVCVTETKVLASGNVIAVGRQAKGVEKTRLTVAFS